MFAQQDKPILIIRSLQNYFFVSPKKAVIYSFPLFSRPNWHAICKNWHGLLQISNDNVMMINATLQRSLFFTLESAIMDQRVIQIKFQGIWRTLEPYQLGLPKQGSGKLTLYGYCRDLACLSLTNSRWQLFEVDQISRIELTTYSFQPHASYSEQTDLLHPIFFRVPISVRVRK